MVESDCGLLGGHALGDPQYLGAVLWRSELFRGELGLEPFGRFEPGVVLVEIEWCWCGSSGRGLLSRVRPAALYFPEPVLPASENEPSAFLTTAPTAIASLMRTCTPPRSTRS